MQKGKNMKKSDTNDYSPKNYDELVQVINKKVYVCCQCNREYPDEIQFRKHIDLCNRKTELTWMWENGYTVKEIKERLKKIPHIPEGIEHITKDTLLIFEGYGVVKKNVKIAKWAMTGFYLSFDGKEHPLNNPFSSLKFLRIEQ